MSFSEWVDSPAGFTASYVLFFAILLVGLIVERCAGPKKPFNRRRAVANYGVLLANLIFTLAAPALSLATSMWAHHRNIGLLPRLHLPLPILIAVTMLARSFAFWVSHLLSHKVPFLWRLHRVHHMDTDVDVSTTERNHPFEGFVGAFLNLPLAIGLGYTPWIIATYELLQIPVVFLSHLDARLPARVERVLRLFIQTPSLHRVHHSAKREETDSNYGDIIVLWDMLFGTYRTKTPAELDAMTLGLEEVRGPRATSLFWLLVSPFLPRLKPDAGALETTRERRPEDQSLSAARASA